MIGFRSAAAPVAFGRNVVPVLWGFNAGSAPGGRADSAQHVDGVALFSGLHGSHMFVPRAIMLRMERCLDRGTYLARLCGWSNLALVIPALLFPPRLTPRGPASVPASLICGPTLQSRCGMSLTLTSGHHAALAASAASPEARTLT